MFLTKRKVPQTGAEIPFRCRGGQYTVTFQRVFPGGGTRKLQMTPPPHPLTEFCHLFHFRMTPPPPPAKKFYHLFHMQGCNNSFLRYTEEHKCPARQNPQADFGIPAGRIFLGLEIVCASDLFAIFFTCRDVITRF